MSQPGASDLLRSMGLLVDGPARWGSPINSRRPGVFVIELAQPLAAAPIDSDALRRWLERVPGLRLDGERPSTHELARRLAGFWLPDEPILYVSRSRKTLGSRLAAMYATPLGDDRPNAGGYWLRALAELPQLRVWWAETDAHEEYEDELLNLVSARQPEEVAVGLFDSAVVLPFANLTAPTGGAKRHGIEDALRATADDGPSATASKPTAKRARASRSPATVAGQTTRARKAATSARPVPAPTYVSASGADDLRAELDNLRNAVRPVVIERVKTARELGDLRENADYEAARNEQSFVEGRIQTLEALLNSAVIVADSPVGDAVAIGSSVVVELDGETVSWQLVGSSEADPASGRISYASPVGQALLGRRVGDEVTAQLPRGQLRLRVMEVR